MAARSADLDLRSVPVLRVAAGARGHDLSEEFRHYGVALVGGGDMGDWREEDPSVFGSEQPWIASLAKAQRGDLVVMNHGQRPLTAGIIAAPYDYRPEFGYVQGWDLYHCLRVRWIPGDELS